MKNGDSHSILLIALVGSLYGFDWLHQGVTQCETISEKMAAGFKECIYYGTGSRGAFSGDSDFYTCTVDENSEYMIFKTKERCNQELEIMRTGAP